MTIVSIVYIIFILSVLLLFRLVKMKYRWMVLLAASLVFFCIAGAWYYLPFMVATSFIVWACARKIGRIYEACEAELAKEGITPSEKKAAKQHAKKRAVRFLLLALFLCVGFLVLTKVLKYILGLPLFSFIELAEKERILMILIPLGVSYYTFSTVSYLLDVYWKRYAYEKNFARFLLYTSYFPHIIQGPISRYNKLGAELKKDLVVSNKQIIFGIELIIWGFFKKLVLADRINVFVSAVFGSQVQAGSIYLLAILMDAFQIYMDFSGYMDIVTGTSQMFGVELEPNFNHPFFSKSVTEFWRRWHMSMGSFFRDYVYYPCTISKWMKRLNRFTSTHISKAFSGFLVVVIPVMITWSLTGLWHGSGLSYLAWGVYWGVLIAISVLCEKRFAGLSDKLHINRETWSWNTFRMVRTFLLFMIGRAISSPNSLRMTGHMFAKIFTDFRPWKLVDNSIFQYGLDYRHFLIIIFGLLFVRRISIFQEKQSVREAISRQGIVFRWLAVIVAVLVVAIFGWYGVGFDSAAFIYQRY